MASCVRDFGAGPCSGCSGAAALSNTAALQAVDNFYYAQPEKGHNPWKGGGGRRSWGGSARYDPEGLQADRHAYAQWWNTQGTLALTAGAVILVHSAPARALYLLPHLVIYPCVLAGDPDAFPWDPDTFPWSEGLPTTVPVALLVVAWAMVCARERLHRQQWYRATTELEAALAKQAVLEPMSTMK